MRVGVAPVLMHSAYSDGYAAGLAKGDEIGTLEGLVMGRDKGFEIWEELGYYAGMSHLYERAIKSEQHSGRPSRKMQKHERSRNSSVLPTCKREVYICLRRYLRNEPVKT